MSTHRTPHGPGPRRSGGGTDRPAAATPRHASRTAGQGVPQDRAARTARPGKGAAAGARSADAPVVTGRDKHGPDRLRSGPDKKARTRAQAGPPGAAGRSGARSDARVVDRGPAEPRATTSPLRQDDRKMRVERGGSMPGERPAAHGRFGSGTSPGHGEALRGPQARRSGTAADIGEDRPGHIGHTAPRSPAFFRSSGAEPQRRGAGAEAEPRRDPAPRPPVAGDTEESHARGAKGTWLYGSHAVAAALANPERHLRRLLLTGEAEAAMRERMEGAWPLTPERIDRTRLDQLLGRDAVHGGVALLADPLSPPSLAEALARPGPVLVLDQVSDPRNVGAILRSAASFGACAVVVQDRNAPDETGVMAKAASGAMERVPLLRAVNLARTLGALKAAGLWVVGLDAAGGRLSGLALAERRVALVLGAEGSGLRRLTRETCDELAGLPMPGGMESLNVSAAAAVALYELTRTPADAA